MIELYSVIGKLGLDVIVFVQLYLYNNSTPRYEE